MRKLEPLKISLLILIAVFLICIAVGNLINNVKLSDYLINVSVEMLGSIITLLFIDLYLNNQEKKLEKKRETIVWKTLKPIIREHISLLFSIYKSTNEVRGYNYECDKLQDFFTGDFKSIIRNLDLTKDAPIHPTLDWLSYLTLNITELNNKYEKILDKYSAYMVPELIDSLENIKESLFHSVIITTIPTVSNFAKMDNKVIPNDIFKTLLDEEDIDKYVYELVHLLKLSEKDNIMKNFYVINNEKWRNDIAPKIGSGRL